MYQHPHSGGEPDRSAGKNAPRHGSLVGYPVTPPPPMQKQTRKWPWILVVVVSALVVACCATFGIPYALAALEISPAGGVANSFCHDLQTHEYSAACGLLSSQLQQQMSQQQFI
jgi:hypothetical protein